MSVVSLTNRLNFIVILTKVGKASIMVNGADLYQMLHYG